MLSRKLLSLLAILFGLVINPPLVGAAGTYPSGTLKINGINGREVVVQAGTSVPVTINVTNASKVCKVYLMYLIANQSSPVKSRLSFPGPRGTTENSKSITTNLDTSGLAPGKYEVFMYANTNCPDETVHGNQDDGFDCDANPTCWSYCEGGGGTRQKVDRSTMPYEPGDLYRTNSNSAYYDSNVVKKPVVNTCGEPQGANPLSNELTPNYRRGECELVACDRSGQNLDNIALYIPDPSGKVPGPHPGDYSIAGIPTLGNVPGGSGSANPSGGSASANPSGSGSSATNVTAKKAADGQVTVPAGTDKLTDKTVLDASAGVTNADTSNQVKVDTKTIKLTEYTGGSITKPVDLTAQNVGGMGVQVGKVVQLISSSSGAISLANSDLPGVTATIRNQASVLAPSGWDGKIAPPIKVSATDAPPAGFKIGDLVVSIGSTTQPLLLDQPATIVFSGVKTGEVAFKEPGGSGGFKPMEKCKGDFTTPTVPDFPGECFAQNETDTKVVTWHFSELGFLLPQVPVFESIDPNVCYSSKKTDDFLVDLTMKPNPNFQSYVIAKTECSNMVTCQGTEQIVEFTHNGNTVQFKTILDPLLNLDFNDISPMTAGKYYRYRVWGLLKGEPTPSNVTPASLNPKWWSYPAVVKVGCFQGGGLNLKELVIPRSPSQ